MPINPGKTKYSFGGRISKPCACGCGGFPADKRVRGTYIRGHKRDQITVSRKISLANKGNKKLSILSINNWKRPEYRKLMAKRTNHKVWISNLEASIWPKLKKYGLSRQFRIPGHSHPYDYGSSVLKIVIEVHGCFWHYHKCRSNRGEQYRLARSRDRKFFLHAKLSGYRYLRLWECERDNWNKTMRVELSQ